MENLLLIIVGILLLIIFALSAKVYFLRKSAQEISAAFRDRLTADTNTLIDLSSRDRYMRKLASEINVQLRLLREERLRYQTGDRALREAVTNVSHDLRTPLTVICGYVDMLERELLSDAARRYLRFISGRVEAMRQMTEELFRCSVVLSADEPLHMEPLSLNALLEESLAAFYPALTGRGIAPDVHMPDAPVIRVIDRAAATRVIGNILSNALKYSAGDLTVTLSPDGWLSFANGAPGLTGVEAGRLLDRYFTVETAGRATGWACPSPGRWQSAWAGQSVRGAKMGGCACG